MTPTATPPPFERTPHLVGLVAEAERLAAAVAGAAPPPGVADELLRTSAVATLRLDGSPIEAPPADPPPAADPSAPSAAAAPGGWTDTLRVGGDGPADERLVAAEYANVMEALTRDDLGGRLATDAADALAELHRILTDGLADPSQQARRRRSDQAVHDASTGRIVFYAAPPRDIPARLHLLANWLATTASREHGLVVSGVVHHELLVLHPFESANGRLARVAARLALRARGLDPHRLAAFETALADDALGYYEEAARTIRRRDLSIWLERWGEAVTRGLRTATDALGLQAPEPPPRAARFVAGLDGDAFTVADYRAGASVGPEQARADLEALLDAGCVRRVAGSRGLRFVRIS